MDFDSLSWAIAEGSDGGAPFCIRFREFSDSFPRERYPHRLNLFWSLLAPTHSGMASEPDTDALHLFENRLVPAVESDNQAILSMALSGKNQKEFVFHAIDHHEFLRRLTEIPQEEERYPIRIYHHEDLSWDYDKRVLADIHP
jgi:uncharacterized protein DUF695